MNVYISDPERRKERTDANADEREIYIAGLSKFVAEKDLDKLFKTVGPIEVIVNRHAELHSIHSMAESERYELSRTRKVFVRASHLSSLRTRYNALSFPVYFLSSLCTRIY